MPSHEDTPLAQAEREIGAALVPLGRSLLLYLRLLSEDHEADFEFASKTIAKYLRQNDVSAFPELPSILRKSSGLADSVLRMLAEYKDGTTSGGRRNRIKVDIDRKLLTLRDSLDQAAKLVEGQELEEPPKRDIHFPPDPKTDFGNAEFKSDPTEWEDDKKAVLLAQAYTAFKEIEASVRSLRLTSSISDYEDLIGKISKTARESQSMIAEGKLNNG